MSEQLAKLRDWPPVPAAKVERTPTGLRFLQPLDESEWVELGRALRSVEGALQWYVGDWVRNGRDDASWNHGLRKRVEEIGFVYKTARNCQVVAKAYDLSRRRDKLGWGHHAELAALPEDEQERLLDACEAEGWGVGRLRGERHRDKPIPKLPSGIYRVFYADPPWHYNNTLPDTYGEVSKHYRTMTLDDLCALPIAERTADDAVLFLWVTSPMLEDAFAVIRAWGFSYKSSFVWDKVKHNFGNYNSVRHELLLVCTRGSATPETKQLYDSVIAEERSGRHSEKPERFREMIDGLYPTGPKLELFARKQTPGWDVYGDES